MTAEAAVSVTVKSAKGDLHTLRGDTPQEFHLHAVHLLGQQDGDALYASTQNVFRSAITAPVQAAPLQAVPDEAQAVSNVVQAFPGATVSTVGQPLPQPQAGSVPQDANTPPINPATGQPFQKYVPPGVSKKTGKPYAGFWTDK